MRHHREDDDFAILLLGLLALVAATSLEWCVR